MPEPLIDVIIPAYQAERWLGAAIDSVLGQHDAALGRVIVVDNGSDDGTAAVARRYPPPVLCLATAQTGSAHARNVGLAASSTRFVAFLDADDLLPAGSLATRLAVLLADATAEMVVGRVLLFRDGQALPADCDAPELRPWTQFAQHAGTTLARRSLFDRIGTFDERLRLVDTVDWLMRAEHAAVNPRRVDRVVLLRRMHPDSLTQAKRDEVQKEYLAVLRWHLRRRREGA